MASSGKINLEVVVDDNGDTWLVNQDTGKILAPVDDITKTESGRLQIHVANDDRSQAFVDYANEHRDKS